MLTVIDLLIRIKNGYMAGNQTVVVPFSKINLAILNILKQEKYLKDYLENQEKSKKSIQVTLLYHKGEPSLKDVKIISKPGRRIYNRVANLKSFLGGLGLTVLSTPKGILTDAQARAQKTGGEVLFKIW